MDPRLIYRESAVRGASPVGLVVLLYEQAIEDLRRALAAFQRRDVEARTRGINHALLVIGHLEATLNKDQGGQVAGNLQRFYQQVRSSLVQAQCQQSAALLEQQISLLMKVRDAWCEVDRMSTSQPAGSGPAQPPVETPTLSRRGWNA